MLKETLYNSLKILKFTRICMENHSAVNGWKELLIPWIATTKGLSIVKSVNCTLKESNSNWELFKRSTFRSSWPHSGALQLLNFSQPASQSISQSVSQSVSQQPVKQSVIQSVSWLVSQSVNQTVKSASQTVSQSVSKSVNQSVSWSVSQSVNQSVNQPDSQSVSLLVSLSVGQSVYQPIIIQWNLY